MIEERKRLRVLHANINRKVSAEEKLGYMGIGYFHSSFPA